MDGLLIDSEKVYHRVSYEIAGELGVPLTDEILSAQMGRSPVESMELFRSALAITHLTAHELVAWRDRKMLAAFKEQVELMPAALDVLSRAARRFYIAIATGSTRNLVDVVVDTLAIRDQLHVILPSDEISRGKPDPEIYLTAARMLGVSPAECVVLEDSSNGALAGHRAGCFVIAVPNRYTLHQDFHFADRICSSLSEAWQVIEEISG